MSHTAHHLKISTRMCIEIMSPTRLLHIDTMHDTIHLDARGLMNTHVKKHLQVVLDLSVYDDLNIEDIDWASMLQLEGDESVDVNIKDFYEVY